MLTRPAGSAGTIDRPGEAAPTLLVSYSDGLGGGIERYVGTVEAALHDAGEPCVRIDMHDRESGRSFLDERRPLVKLGRQWRAQRGLLRALTRQLAARTPRRIVLAYVHLLPVALWATRRYPSVGITVVMYGNEIWAPGTIRRVARRLLRHRRVRPVAISGFSAGALYPLAPAGVLPPGLSADWYDTLVAAGRARPERGPGIRVMTSFRLESWREKGLPELVEAVRSLGRADVSLAICGSGPLPDELRHLVAAHPFCTLHHNLSDADLAAQFAAADLFVLATRLQQAPVRSGEGFGLVLAEAQLTGTPVVAPAYGGCSDAFAPGISGVAPVDQSGAALADAVAGLVGDPDRLASMGQAAASWARAQFDPARYAILVRETLR